MRTPARLALALALGVCLLGSTAVEPQGSPIPPCGARPHPAYPEIDAPPNVSAWTDEMLRGWAPPACTRWASPTPAVVVALAGSFRPADGADSLLGRFGAVSRFRGIRYWSVSDKGWRTLITDAFAVNGPDPRSKRPDFAAAELAVGKDVFFAQKDSRSSGAVVYRMRVTDHRPDRIVVEMENVGAVRLYGLTVFGPGELRSVYFVERLSPRVWGYYALTAAGARAEGREASFVNRAVAFYRHVIGVPTDRDPPVARGA